MSLTLGSRLVETFVVAEFYKPQSPNQMGGLQGGVAPIASGWSFPGPYQGEGKCQRWLYLHVLTNCDDG